MVLNHLAKVCFNPRKTNWRKSHTPDYPLFHTLMGCGRGTNAVTPVGDPCPRHHLEVAQLSGRRPGPQRLSTSPLWRGRAHSLVLLALPPRQHCYTLELDTNVNPCCSVPGLWGLCQVCEVHPAVCRCNLAIAFS